MSTRDFEERIKKLREKAERHGIDGFFIASEPNMRYFTGFSTLAIERLVSAFISTEPVEPILIVPKLEEEKAKKLSFFKDIRSYTDAEGPRRAVGEAIHELNLSEATLGVEDSLPFKFYRMIKEADPSLDVKEASAILNWLRSIKSKGEIELMKRAAYIAVEGVMTGIESIKVGVSELSVAFEIEKEMIKLGGESVPFCLVLSGENSALPHGSTSNRKIKKGDAVIMDVGVTYKGYYADITRTIFVGEINETQRKVYNVVLKAQENAVDFVKPWIKACQVDRKARGVIEEADYGEFFTHRTGHGLGLEVHEEPYITQTNETTLKPRMVFTVEPGIYLHGSFGVRIEDDILVTEDEKEVLTKMPKDLLVV
ncbi:MAG: Xaa-Pro peptidase family protein [Candidatus Bathyarchaeia archaeon]|nr:aminopeptidase P family protein [Candidatus Bathyarchaeota archaeon]